MIGFAAAFLVAASLHADSASILRRETTIPLAGVQGRIDHLAVDLKANRLYVAALGNNTVEVIDLKAGKRTEAIHGMKEPQGILVIPDSGKIVLASGEDGQCRVYDCSLKLLGAVGDLDDADNVRYDAQAKLAYVGYGKGALAVIDPEKIAKLADIQLEGHPESFQLETKGNRIFVNVPTAHHIAVIDRQKRAVVAKWPVKEAAANFPMALDEADHRLLIGCRQPARLLVLDTETGKVIAQADCCGDTDDLFYDSATKHVYISGGEGHISVFQQTDPDHYRLVGTVKTASGARTSLFVPATRNLYLAVPHRGEQQAELRVYKVEMAHQ